MRRISRLRRPSTFPTSASRSPIIPLLGQSPISSRLYSSGRQPSSETVDGGIEEAPDKELQELKQEDQVSQQWEIYAPLPPRSHAERLDEISDPKYVPAMTSEGLETVGGLDNWWNKKKHWPKSADFTGFRPLKKVDDPAVLEASVRRAVVEAFALREAGREHDLVNAWPVGGQEDLRRLMEVDLNVAEGGAVLSGDISSVVDEYTTKELTSEGTHEQPVPSINDSQKYVETWGHGWKAASLSDPRIKFAVTKRIFRLTGQLIPDHQLSSISDVRSLLRVLQKPPKPRTLTQEIQEHRQDLVQLPNISVATKRVTRGDREKALGRFKLVEEELKKRELPLKGHGFVRKNTEISRLKGGV